MVRKTKSKEPVGVPAESVLVAPVSKRKTRKKSKPPPEPVLKRAESKPVAVHAESVLRAPVYKKKVPSKYCEFVRREYHTTTHLPVRDRLRDLGKRWQALKTQKKSA